MKNLIMFLLFSPILVCGCESQPVSAENQAKLKSFCNTNDPINELAWLKQVVGSDLTNIWISNYKGRTVVVYDKIATNALPDACYYCNGVMVKSDNKEDEENFFSALDMTPKKAILINY